MNKVIIVGNLTKDVELRSTQSGKSVASFTVAVQRQFKVDGQPEADFFPVVVWGVQGENCAKYLSKGKKVAIVGSLQNRSFDDKNENKRSLTEIIASEVEFLTPRSNEPENHLKTAQEMFGEQVPPVTDDDVPF
jgi:single-strand DNA-binding protein